MVAGVRYAVDIQLVREIVNPLSLVGLPHAPPEMIGVADHRGAVLPVVDLRARFGVERLEDTGRTKWLIIRPSRRSLRAVALVVDAVTEVFGTSRQARRDLPDISDGDVDRGIEVVYAHEDDLVFVINPAKVASAALRLEDGADSLPPGNDRSGEGS